MTSEAAVLGVPSLRCNSFAGRISYLEEEEKKYGLTYAFLPSEFDRLKAKLQELLSMDSLRSEWQKRRQRMLEDKIDLTKFMLWFIENWPNSISS
jgi:predicted glycosyltransferase